MKIKIFLKFQVISVEDVAEVSLGMAEQIPWAKLKKTPEYKSVAEDRAFCIRFKVIFA